MVGKRDVCGQVQVLYFLTLYAANLKKKHISTNLFSMPQEAFPFLLVTSLEYTHSKVYHVYFFPSHQVATCSFFKGKRALPTINFESIFHENLTEHH